MNKTEKLQSIFDEIKPNDEDYYEFTVEYKPHKGWYLTYMEKEVPHCKHERK